MMTLLKRNLNLSDTSKSELIIFYLFMIVALIYCFIVEQSIFLSMVVMLTGVLSSFPVYASDYLNRNQSYITFRSLPTSDRLLLQSFNLYIFIICSIQVSGIVLTYLIMPFPKVFEVLAAMISLTLFIATFCVHLT